jgi:anti-anti-sigma regulatory factor
LTVRITTTTVGEAPTVAAEGCLTAAEVPSLREACRSVGAGLRLDLSGLRMADEAGMGELRRRARSCTALLTSPVREIRK